MDCGTAITRFGSKVIKVSVDCYAINLGKIGPSRPILDSFELVLSKTKHNLVIITLVYYIFDNNSIFVTIVISEFLMEGLPSLLHDRVIHAVHVQKIME